MEDSKTKISNYIPKDQKINKNGMILGIDENKSEQLSDRKTKSVFKERLKSSDQNQAPSIQVRVDSINIS